MMHTPAIYPHLDQNAALVRALGSLRIEDIETVAKVVDGFGGRWSVQTGDDYDGYRFMLIEPAADLAEQLPTYMVSGTTSQIELALVNGDDCHTVGRFGNIDRLATQLASQLRMAAG